ncbi:MAG: COG3650 family protein [Gemmatimonadaceae bacterium]
MLLRRRDYLGDLIRARRVTVRLFSILAVAATFVSCSPRPDVAVDTPVVDTAAVDTAARPQPANVPWDDARRRGVDFRAIGQEPGWMVEIDHETSIYVLADYGEKKVTTPVPAPRDSAGTTIYNVRTEAHHLTIRIQLVACADAMSGEQMTHTVTINLDGTEYRGCGRDLTTR